MHPPPIMTTSAVAFMMRPQFTLQLCAYGRGDSGRVGDSAFLRITHPLVNLRSQIADLRFSSQITNRQISDLRFQIADFRFQVSDFRQSQTSVLVLKSTSD